MKTKLVFAVLLAWCSVSFGERTLDYGPFGKVWLYGDSIHNPSSVVLFISGNRGWGQDEEPMAQKLSSMGVLVVGIDFVHYFNEARKIPGPCLYPAADFERLSQFIQKELNYETYVTPFLFGYGSGGTLVYATLAQAPSTTFGGGVSLGFCPELLVDKRVCPGSGLKSESNAKKRSIKFLPDSLLQVSWYDLHGENDKVCPPQQVQEFIGHIRTARLFLLPGAGHDFAREKNWMPTFVRAYEMLAKREQGPKIVSGAVAGVIDLPLVKVEADPSKTSRQMVIHWTGDGGWGITDHGLAEALSAQGIPTAGFNSLKYFWTKRTPEDAAMDCAKVFRYYSSLWNRDSLILIGYSFGADALPFIVNRLPQDVRSRVSLVVLISPSQSADFQFHFASWFGATTKDAQPVLPEVKKINGTKILCFYGKDDKESLGPLIVNLAKVIPLETGHRVGHGFDPIVEQILESVK